MCMTLLPAPTSPPSPRRDGDPTWSSTPPGNRTQPVRGSPIDSEIPNDDIQARHDSGAAPSPVNNDPLALWLPAARAGAVSAIEQGSAVNSRRPDLTRQRAARNAHVGAGATR